MISATSQIYVNNLSISTGATSCAQGRGSLDRLIDASLGLGAFAGD